MRKNSGPPKKPTALKLLQGTFRRDRVAQNEPRPEITIPVAPDHLSAEAKQEWERVSKELAQLGLLSNIDRAALAAYCAAWAFAALSEVHCYDGEGNVHVLITTKAGNIIENPYFSVWKRSMELMHKFLTEFGMTPASRSRISVPSDLPRQNKYAGLA